MLVEGCSLCIDGDLYEGLVDFSKEVNWNGHRVTMKDGMDTTIIKRFVPMGRNVGGSVEAKKDQEGNSSVAAEGHVTVKDDNGNKVSVSAEASVKRDTEGTVSTEVVAKIALEKSF